MENDYQLKEKLDVYNKLKTEMDKLQVQLDLIKGEIEEQMKIKGLDEFNCEYGQVKYIISERNQFNQGVAKSFLTSEQLEKCMEKKSVNYLRIVNPLALENMRRFGGKKDE